MLRKKSPGFTLIEIVIVLAIAALIMIIVFLAVQGAQRSRRDTQRKTNLDYVAAQLIAFSSTNKGKYPSTSSGLFSSFVSQWNGFALSGNNFVNQYLLKDNPNFKDPNGNSYNFATTAASIPAGTAVGSSVFGACGSTAAPENQKPTGGRGAGIAYAVDSNSTRYQIRICLESGDYFKDSAQ